METIPKSECRKIGFIRKAHGVQGELVLEYEPESEDSVAGASRFLLEIDGLLVPFFVVEDGFRFKTSNSAIIRVDWINSENQARRLVGSSVYIFASEIIKPGDETSLSGLTGFRLLDEHSEEIGVVTAVDNYSGNVVLTLDAKGKEILVPFNDDLVLDIDIELKIIRLRLPEGLLE